AGRGAARGQQAPWGPGGARRRAAAPPDGRGAAPPGEVGAGGGAPAAATADMLAVLKRDAARARAAFRFVAAQPSIGSQMIDNLNASIHVRTLLTDLFLIDEAIDTGDA